LLYVLPGLALKILHAAAIIVTCCLWTSDQTAAFSFKSINRFVLYKQGRECLLCSMHWIPI